MKVVSYLLLDEIASGLRESLAGHCRRIACFWTPPRIGHQHGPPPRGTGYNWVCTRCGKHKTYITVGE